MSKELKAWEELKNQYKDLISNTDIPKLREDEKQRLEIIESALKNYQEGLDNARTYVKHTSKQALYDLLGLAIKNVHPSYWKLPEQLCEDVNKSLKALDLIGEILVGVSKGSYADLNTAIDEIRKVLL